MVKSWINLLIASVILMACSKDDNISTTTTTDRNTGLSENHEQAGDYSWDRSEVIEITLRGSAITANSDAITVDGTKATITKAGVYRVKGQLSNGQVVVNTKDTATVKVIFSGIDITNQTNAPFAVLDAKKTVVVLEENTQNKLTDTKNYTFAAGEDEPDATLFSKDNLTIYGQKGSLLTIDANYKEAIKSKDGLIMREATVNLTAADDGIQGKDYLIIKDGNYTLNVGGDGLKSNNDDNERVGYINIETGTFSIVSKSDGIQAESRLKISGGTFNITSGGGSGVSVAKDKSAKGMKAKKEILIEGNPTFAINVAEDGVHSDDNLVINGGDFTVSANDDGIHSDKTLTINSGNILITKSEEGIEGSQVRINGGNIDLTANDDGLNAAGDFRPITLDINGGIIFIDANGDGIDANGTITMKKGLVVVHGPTGNWNAALDYDNRFDISGGLLLAVGSRNMAQAPSTSSAQNSISYKTGTAKIAGTLIHLEKDNGQRIFTFSPSKAYQSVVFSSPELTNGTTYRLYFGGEANGKATGGLYGNGVNYTKGILSNTFTVNGKLTELN